jgi:hypothetical protein
MLNRNKRKLIKFNTIIKSFLVLSLSFLTIFASVYAIKKPKTTKSDQAATQATGLHRLGIKSGTTRDYFYDTVTNQRVILRGNNFFRYGLVTQSNGTQKMVIVTFKPGFYNHDDYKNQLTEMKKLGFNAVRATIMPNYATSNGVIDQNYVANITDFVNMAYDNGIYVNFVIGLIPTSYWPSRVDKMTNMNDYFAKLVFNLEVLNHKNDYLKDFVGALKAKGTHMEAIATWSPENEPFFDKNLWPLNMTSGAFVAPNDKVYNMADPADKTKMAEESMAYAADQNRLTIRSVDPDALVTWTLFSPNSVGIFGPSYADYTSGIINLSHLDLIAINLYPGPNKDIDSDIKAFGIGSSKKAIMQTEFGAYKKDYDTINKAAAALKDIQVKTCGLGWTGWLTYDWDTKDTEDGIQLYRATDGGGVINKTLAPFYRANPCSPNSVTISGNVDSVTDRTITGWIFDQETLQNTKVNFFIDTPTALNGWTNFLGSAWSDLPRTEINSLNPWMLHPGFTFKIPVNFLADGKTHTVHAQAVDMKADGTAGSYYIPGSGKTIPFVVPTPVFTASCSTTAQTAPGCVKPGSVYSLAVTGIPSTVKTNFATWNETNGLDDLVSYPGYLLPDGKWRGLIDGSNHPGSGNMRTNIRKIDPVTGSDTLCVAVTVPLCAN